LYQAKSRWVPAAWSDLPGFADDALFDAWNAWLKSCERPGGPLATLWDVRRLSIGSADEQRAWMMERLQPFRIESPQGEATGLLTAYYEPMMDASRLPTATFNVPLYQPPAGLAQRKPWYTRQEMDTLPEAQAALQGRAIAYMADPVDALVLQIQGSGRIRISQPDGNQRWRPQPMQAPTTACSVGRCDQGLVGASGPASTWLAQNLCQQSCCGNRAWCFSARRPSATATPATARAAPRAWR
jgi:membrane-bound lytic murein transglycosylase A